MFIINIKTAFETIGSSVFMGNGMFVLTLYLEKKQSLLKFRFLKLNVQIRNTKERISSGYHFLFIHIVLKYAHLNLKKSRKD